MKKRTRIIVAVLVCAGILLLYGIIGALLGFKNGGGAIPILICFGLMGLAWKVITKEDQGKEK